MATKTIFQRIIEGEIRADVVYKDEQCLAFGYSTEGRLLVVSHMDRGDQNRIISARRATQREKITYEE